MYIGPLYLWVWNIWLESHLRSFPRMESQPGGSTGLRLRGWPHSQGSVSITLVETFCGGPTPTAALCSSGVPVVPGGSILWNLGGGSQVPHALLDAAQATPGLTGAPPAVAEECGGRMQGVESTVWGSPSFQTYVPQALALWAWDRRSRLVISEMPLGSSFHCLGQ